MLGTLQAAFETALPRRPKSDSLYVTELVAAILSGARQARASDVHLVPGPTQLKMAWRVDGVLQQLAEFPGDLSARIVARLKVLAELLTYQTELPQEGRIRDSESGVEMRVSTFPTLFGEKVVIRLLGERHEFQCLSNLGFTPDVQAGLERLVRSTQGAILIAGPAGSGKTTTLYACLREIAQETQGQRSLVSLEDPIEAVISGMSQSQVNPAAGFDLTTGLRSLLRQDPEVMMVGEIRDRSAAEIVFQASLTGHLVLTTFHAGSAANVVGRLSEMNIEPYLLRSGLIGVVWQRLVRRLCACSQPGGDAAGRMGLDVKTYRQPAGCGECHGTGYRGRLVLCEMLIPDQTDVGRSILSRSDATEIERLAQQAGMVTRWQRACQAVESGQTSPVEVRRVLGFSPAGGPHS